MIGLKYCKIQKSDTQTGRQQMLLVSVLYYQFLSQVFDVLLLGAHTARCLVFSCRHDPFVTFNTPSLSLITLFAPVSEINIDTPTFFSLVLAWDAFLLPLFLICIFVFKVGFLQTMCNQVFFFICFGSLCLSIGVARHSLLM